MVAKIGNYQLESKYLHCFFGAKEFKWRYCSQQQMNLKPLRISRYYINKNKKHKIYN